jgi:hypothetical protein
LKKLTVLLASFLLLAACSDDQAAAPKEETQAPKKEEAAAEQKEMAEKGFITRVTESEILVNNIYFTVGKDVTVQSDNGSEKSDAVISDIRAGMKVSVDYKGPLGGSFPMEGDADAVTILTDEESAEQADALQAFIKEEKLSSILMMGQPIVRDNEFGFLFNNMETGEVSEVKVDLDTHKYTIDGK